MIRSFVRDLTHKLARLSLHPLTVTFFKCFLYKHSENQTSKGFNFTCSNIFLLVLWHCTVLPFYIWISKCINCSLQNLTVIWKFFFLFHWHPVAKGPEWTVVYNSSLCFPLLFFPWSPGGQWIISEITISLRSLKEKVIVQRTSPAEHGFL